MVYYYPFGIIKNGENSLYAETTTSASAAISATIVAYTASHAIVAQSAGVAGPTGPAPTSCDAGPQGPSGSIGLTGTRGSALTGCPSGTKLCSNITPPSGYILVCIQPPPGCTVANTLCPGEVTTTTTTTTSTTTTTTTTLPPAVCSPTGEFITGVNTSPATPAADATAACALTLNEDIEEYTMGGYWYPTSNCSGPQLNGYYKYSNTEYVFYNGTVRTVSVCGSTTTTTSTTTLVPGTCYQATNGPSSPTITVQWTSRDGAAQSAPLSAGTTVYLCSLTPPTELGGSIHMSVATCDNAIATPCTNMCTAVTCKPCADLGTCFAPPP